jgi:hypothetical protein
MAMNSSRLPGEVMSLLISPYILSDPWGFLYRERSDRSHGACTRQELASRTLNLQIISWNKYLFGVTTAEWSELPSTRLPLRSPTTNSNPKGTGINREERDSAVVVLT